MVACTANRCKRSNGRESTILSRTHDEIQITIEPAGELTYDDRKNGTLIGDKRELTRENEKNTWCKMKLTTDSEKTSEKAKTA